MGPVETGGVEFNRQKVNGRLRIADCRLQNGDRLRAGLQREDWFFDNWVAIEKQLPLRCCLTPHLGLRKRI